MRANLSPPHTGPCAGTTARVPGGERIAWWIAGLAVVSAGLTLRVMGAWGELWLDEILTLNLLADRAPSPFHVFWSVQHDNVHPLYGFYAWFMPDYPHPLLYRLPALLLGAGTIVLAGLIGRRRSAAEALFAMVLAALAYPMVHYGSEARGYGPMMFCILMAFWLIDGDLQEGAARRRSWVALAFVGAVLFHATAVLAVLALGLWFLLDRFRETGSPPRARAQAFRYFLPGMVVLLFLYSVFVAAALTNGVQWGGFVGPAGVAGRFVAQVGEMVKMFWGLPAIMPAWAGLGAVAAGVAAVIAWLFRQRDRRAPLYVIVLLGLPAALFVAGMNAHAFGRYYLFALVFLVPLAAQGLAGAWHRGRMGKTVCLVLLAMFLAGSARSNALFLAHGRGDMRAVIARLVEPGRGAVVRVGADYKWRFGIIATYHGRDVAPGIRFEILQLGGFGPAPPRWLVLHHYPTSGAVAFAARGRQPAPRVKAAGARYVLDRVYRHWGLSGFDWMVYRREPGTRPGGRER